MADVALEDLGLVTLERIVVVYNSASIFALVVGRAHVISTCFLLGHMDRPLLAFAALEEFALHLILLAIIILAGPLARHLLVKFHFKRIILI